MIFDLYKFHQSPAALNAALRHVSSVIAEGGKALIVADDATIAFVQQAGLVSEFVRVRGLLHKLAALRDLARSSGLRKVPLFVSHAVAFGPVALLLGRRFKLIYWCQGVVAAEMRLSGDRWHRILAMHLLETYAILRADAVLAVSTQMANYWRGRLSRKSEVYVVPCAPRTGIIPGIVRRPMSFCYVGGASPWQCIGKMLEIFQKIQECAPDCTLTVVTRDVDEFRSELQRAGLANSHSICITTLNGADELSDFLSGIEFGFLLRDPHLVNAVSSPIKFGEYISCGVTPIISEGIGDYSEILRNRGFRSVMSEGKPIMCENFLARPDDALLLAKQLFSAEACRSTYKSIIEG
ncbi:hypothetical protein [Cupriavidus lacunae]|uniref:hypothetical protein n=1 Tax=Cupriavidus lacunae TaxID=2666307 RepID=UPI0010589A18|nr:hypothetical protein [Cupriavidus lacunae]